MEGEVKENIWEKKGGACGIQTGQLSGGGVSEGESLRVAMWALLFLGPPHAAVNEKKMSELWRAELAATNSCARTTEHTASLSSLSFYFLSFIKLKSGVHI